MIALVLLTALLLVVRHQRLLKRRAYLMQEAVRNRDFSFRLPTDGLLPGERAMQHALNQMSDSLRQQLNQREVEAWEKLTRVLTHEIMNSTAPIMSITQSMLCRDDVKGTPLEEGIRAIGNTSRHLNTFVDSYRKLSQVAKPNVVRVELSGLLADICSLYPAIDFRQNVPSGSVVNTDQNMLRQIAVNLVKNAIEAEAATVSFDFNGKSLLVSNDGSPIPAEAKKSIFVPFFTTKRTGSGIGLSLSRQMMIQQGGNLSLADVPAAGFATTFVVEFSI